MTGKVVTRAQEAEYAKKLLARADQILASIDDAYIIQHRGHSPRPMPTFRPEEIRLGNVLGRGGFGIVQEVEKITLDDEEEEEQVKVAEQILDERNPQESKTVEEVASSKETNAAAAAMNGKDDQKKETSNKNKMVPDADENFHYEISFARQVMQKRVKRYGVPRYALKRLHGNLSEIEKARGMIDLAIEAKYLSVVWHPNIIKMRAMASGSMVHDDFFIILDRLHGTLDRRIYEWRKKAKSIKNTFLRPKNKRAQKELLVERLTVAYDLAAAFFYLHENRLVYRDIKPENVGFDLRGDVKIFDFGLCKSLSSKLRAREGEYGYKLTGRAGSLPYMAPEVAKMETYDTKCDVFSYAVLLWEILALKPAWYGYSAQQFMEKVVVENERLEVSKDWPPLTRLMLPEAWDKDPSSRPDMKRVAIMIRGDLNDMTTDDHVLRRTKHMRERSNHSIVWESGASDRELDQP